MEKLDLKKIQTSLQTIGKNNSYQAQQNHHEIYLSDPRKTSPEKLKTILIYKVK